MIERKGFFFSIMAEKESFFGVRMQVDGFIDKEVLLSIRIAYVRQYLKIMFKCFFTA